jgi:chemotaxis-related protein WspB
MLLVFQAGPERYALDCRQVIEVVPRIPLRPVPGAPDYVVGVFRYRGAMVPVIDLTRLLIERPSSHSMSTRIVLVRYVPEVARNAHVLGLMAEKVLDTINRPASEFQPSGVTVTQAPFLGELTTENDELVQRVEVDALLPDELQHMLFKED